MSGFKFEIKGPVYIAKYNRETGEITDKQELKTNGAINFVPKDSEPIKPFTVSLPTFKLTFKSISKQQYNGLYRLLFGSPLEWMLYRRLRHFSKN